MLIFVTVYLFGFLISHFTVFACSGQKRGTHSTLCVTTSREPMAPCQPRSIVSEAQDVLKIARHLVYETYRSMLIGDIPRTRHLTANLRNSNWWIILHEVVDEGREFIISVRGEQLIFDLILSPYKSHSTIHHGAYIIEAFEFTGLFRVDKSLGEVSVLGAKNYRVLDRVEDVYLSNRTESIRKNVVLVFNSSISSAACRLA